MWSGLEFAARAAFRLVQMHVARFAPVSLGFPYQLDHNPSSVSVVQEEKRGRQENALHQQAAVADGLLVRLSVCLVEVKVVAQLVVPFRPEDDAIPLAFEVLVEEEGGPVESGLVRKAGVIVEGAERMQRFMERKRGGIERRWRGSRGGRSDG